jgi:hypothetical protein
MPGVLLVSGVGPPVVVGAQTYDFGLWPALICGGMLVVPAVLGSVTGLLANRDRAGAARLVLGGALGTAAGGATLAVLLVLSLSLRAVAVLALAYGLPTLVAAAVGFAVPYAAAGGPDDLE